VWAVALGRLPRLPTLLVTVFGSVVASGALIALNHGAAPVAFILSWLLMVSVRRSVRFVALIP